MKYIKLLEDISLADVAQVGGKNASLGEMITTLQSQGICVPTGFAITADAYWYYLKSNDLESVIFSSLDKIYDLKDLVTIQETGKKIRNIITAGTIPQDLAQEIIAAYDQLCKKYGSTMCDVAVRSSATSEDLPDASFAGQQETYLNIKGHDELLQAYKLSLASLFTDRAIVYRQEKGFDHSKVALSTGVQKMIRSDKAVSGVMFTLDTDSGFADVVMINAAYGLGELVVKGEITPDEYWVHKPTLRAGFAPIIKKELGSKLQKMIYTVPSSPYGYAGLRRDEGGGVVSETTTTTKISTSELEQNSFCLTEPEILDLARMALVVEDHYSSRKGSWCPMDIEWAKDGNDGKLYIIQARPETVHSNDIKQTGITRYSLQESPSGHKVLVTGNSIGNAIISGIARVIPSAEKLHLVQEGDIIVTHMTDPDWTPVLKKAAGIITNSGGRTCHAAIVSRELGIPALVGAAQATEKIVDGSAITLDCSQGSIGYVYQGSMQFNVENITVDNNKKHQIPVSLMMNVAQPERAFNFSFLPNDGVGLARTEFIISGRIKVHPMACVHPEKITDVRIKKEIDDACRGYQNQTTFFVETLASGIATIAAAFYPKPVIVRTSDFKSNEYRNLIAGNFFEPEEENPMLGLRGASRYYSLVYQEAFKLECHALKKVREVMGFKNVKIMLPFVRTVTEAQKVIGEMAAQGLQRGVDGLELIMMCEVPSNVLLIDEFSHLFDGFSIGSNDLTQLTLGVDRDSGILTQLFNEQDQAVKKMLELSVTGARRNNKYIGICGQAPSDYPDIAHMLINLGINALSLNPDSIVSFINSYTRT